MNYETLCAYLERKPGAWRDMPFGPEVLVFKVFNKMFALVAWQADPLRISLKAAPVDAIIMRRQYAAVKPGYHLNKNHWNTVTLDGSVPDDELRIMMDDSYDLVVEGVTRAEQELLRELGWSGSDRHS